MATPGERIEYTIIASNDGNVDLVHFSLTDKLFSVIGGKTWSAICSSRLRSRNFWINRTLLIPNRRRLYRNDLLGNVSSRVYDEIMYQCSQQQTGIRF